MPPVLLSLERRWNELIAGTDSAPSTNLSELLKQWQPESRAEWVLLAAYALSHGSTNLPFSVGSVDAELKRNGHRVLEISRGFRENLESHTVLHVHAADGAFPGDGWYELTRAGVDLVAQHLKAGAWEAGAQPLPKGANASRSVVPADDDEAIPAISGPAANGPVTTANLGSSPNERVPLHSDHPASVDELGRRPFAEIIARRLEENRQTWARLAEVGDEDADRAIMVGIHGPWGAGKSTVLNLLRAQLKDDARAKGDRWVVVEFNAWRNQRIRPPWWTLIQAVYAGSVRQIGFWRALWLRARWLMWRARADWLPAVAAAVFIAAAVLLTTGVYNGISTEASGDTLGKAVELGLKIITAVFAAGAAAIAFSRSLLFGSSRAAQAYTEMRSSDPLRPIVRMFSKLVRAIGRPVAVFVDDLDRCDAKYVVELLEGMQTLFRTVPIAYVVAADRKWIAASFAKGYEDFGGEIGEPGRPLGYLFLDKLFQLSAALPLLSPERKRAYWSGLLRASGSADPAEMEKERKAAEVRAAALIGGASTHEELSSAIAAHTDDAVLQEGLRAVAAKRITSREAEQETAHRLQHFDELLEPNPRSMKRLVNAYGLHPAAQYIETGGVQPETLARWTIVELRWRLLAEYLANHPGAVARIGTGEAPESAPAVLAPLFRDDTLHAVVAGTEADDPGLDEAAIRRITGRRPAPSRAEIVQTANATIPAPQPADGAGSDAEPLSLAANATGGAQEQASGAVA